VGSRAVGRVDAAPEGKQGWQGRVVWPGECGSLVPPDTLESPTMNHMVRVETVLDSWKSVRQDAAQAVEEFPAVAFDFKPAAEMMTFGEIAAHILNSGHALTGMLLEGEDNMTRPDFRARMAQHYPAAPKEAGPAALAKAMRESVEVRTAELARQTPSWFGQIITRFDGQQVTRLEMLQFIKEHELTHRSQLFVYSRLKGIVPVTTRRRQAAK
jgi:uncharacterized damage-inducible protein DinB